MLVVLWCTYMCVFTIIYEYTCLCVVLMYTSIHTHKNMERICCYRIDGAKTKGLKTSQTSTPISVISSNHSQAELTTVHLKSSLRSPTPVTTRRNRCRRSASQTIPWLGRWSLFHFPRQTAFPLLAVSPLGDQPRTCHSPAPVTVQLHSPGQWIISCRSLFDPPALDQHLFDEAQSLLVFKLLEPIWDFHHWSIRREI